MDHFERIYASQAAEYHRMIAVEDVDRNLLPALERAAMLSNRRILDLGSGTGRLTLLLRPLGAKVVGVDLNLPMLREQERQRDRAGLYWPLTQADIRDLPFPTGWADVITAGWAIGHLRSWFEGDWQAQIGRILREMHRVVRPGGALIIMETLSTGSLTPAPPTPGLAEFYAWLEGEWGFTRETIATDYQFASVDDAVANTEFFFGAEMAEAIRRNGWARLPEWTGVWSKRVRRA